MKKVNCGDWHLGWGYSGHDKIGKLELVNEITDRPGWYSFLWKGHSQGRHGGTWNHGATLEFNSDGVAIETLDSKGSCPERSEILESVNLLLRMQDTERVKLAKRVAKQITTDQLDSF